MAIQTESYFSVMYGDDEVDKIGLSDTLDNYTAEEIQAYMLCGCRDKLLGGNLGLYDYGGGSYDVWNAGTPFATGTVDYTYMHMFNGNGDNSTADLQGRYCGTVLLTDDLAAFPLCVTSNNIANFKLITELDIKNYCMNISATLTQKGGIGATDLNDKTNTLYCVDIDLAALYYRYGTPPVDVAVTLAVVPYHVFDVGGELFLVNGYKTNKLGFSCRLAPNRNAGMEIYPISSSADDASYSLAFNNIGFGDDYSDFSSNTYAWAYGYDTVNKFGSTDADLWYQCYFGILMFDVRYYYTNYNQMMMQFANTGLLFKVAGVIYKPLISDNVVYGYTDNLDAPSDIDNWERDTKHDVPITPPTPPTPPPDPWDVDPETYGWSGGEVSGMVKYYLLTAGQMSQLQSAIASNANWTIDYLNCIVSCFVVPNSGIFFDAPIPTTVKFVLDNATQWDTGVSCKRIQGTKNKSGGTIEIPRLTNTFYDFEPYSDYSVYIPFCGRVPIKGNVCLGHEIKVTYYPDVPTCSLTAVVSCGGATIAIAKGSFGTMTPVTSNGSDRKTAAVIGDVAPIITGIGTGIVGVALGNPLIVGAGATQALGGIMGGVKETVQSYAYSVGSTGDSSFFSAGNRCYYYANYPLIDSVVNNSMFGHSVGYLCNTVGKLSGFKGFTICANPHVTFSATAEEREEIEKLLSMGVIL